MQRQPILTERDLSLFQLRTRYVRNYLTFAGKNSKDFLLYLSGPGVYDSPQVDMYAIFCGFLSVPFKPVSQRHHLHDGIRKALPVRATLSELKMDLAK